MNRISTPLLWVSASMFALFTAATGLRLLHGFDRWALRTTQAWSSEVLDAIGEFFSTVGGIEFTMGALLLLLAAVFFGGRRTLAKRILVAFLITSAVEIVMKLWLPQVPLSDVFSRSAGRTPTAGISLPYPYPSGHMLRATVLLGTTFVLWKNRIGRGLLSIVFVGMALTRVYMGVHWASDVIGGALLGLAGLAWIFRYRKGD